MQDDPSCPIQTLASLRGSPSPVLPFWEVSLFPLHLPPGTGHPRQASGLGTCCLNVSTLPALLTGYLCMCLIPSHCMGGVLKIVFCSWTSLRSWLFLNLLSRKVHTNNVLQFNFKSHGFPKGRGLEPWHQASEGRPIPVFLTSSSSAPP